MDDFRANLLLNEIDQKITSKRLEEIIRAEIPDGYGINKDNLTKTLNQYMISRKSLQKLFSQSVKELPDFIEHRLRESSYRLIIYLFNTEIGKTPIDYKRFYDAFKYDDTIDIKYMNHNMIVNMALLIGEDEIPSTIKTGIHISSPSAGLISGAHDDYYGSSRPDFTYYATSVPSSFNSIDKIIPSDIVKFKTMMDIIVDSCLDRDKKYTLIKFFYSKIRESIDSFNEPQTERLNKTILLAKTRHNIVSQIIDNIDDFDNY